ncbi:hypothetical protein K402DRAFT_179164 [Aulographum hederae CBS 113979]|uniref:RING-type domain-containing protein n=1 Tax=Aulographum hederae CBS 113979 TaxID=1176131 RepID=A0A6G1GQG2_9PEZI|nr:hypothetical protein K402DRAFT_179164 [Aulographum hederae CBS 113979]
MARRTREPPGAIFNGYHNARIRRYPPHRIYPPENQLNMSHRTRNTPVATFHRLQAARAVRIAQSSTQVVDIIDAFHNATLDGSNETPVKPKKKARFERTRPSYTRADSVPQYEEPEVPLRSCIICYKDKDEAYFPIFISMCCEHEADVCLICLREYIQAETRDGNYHIKCPSTDCTEELATDEVRSYVPTEIFEQ